jgi:hypothetical protein
LRGELRELLEELEERNQSARPDTDEQAK